jgi:hypothetical protein
MAKEPRKRLRRAIKIKGQETPAERQTRTAVRFIMDNPYYSMILAAIRSGTPNSQIAEWAINRGYFSCNQKTAVGYLQYFRKAQPNLCRPIVTQDSSEDDIDVLFDGAQLVMDEETELLRLIKLQKARLGLLYANERRLSLVMSNGKKEVEELRELIMALAKLRGLIGNTMDVNVHGYSDTVKDDLKSIQQDENGRNVMATLITELAGNF